MKKQFSQMNDKERMSYYRKRQCWALGGKWASIIAPFGIVFGVKFNEYFAIVSEAEQVKLSLGCILAIIVAAISVYNEAKLSSDNKKFPSVVGWGVATVLCYLFSSILNDLLLIISAEFVGQLSAFGLNAYSESCKKEVLEYKKLARDRGTLKK